MKPLSFVAVTVTAVLAFTSAESQTIRYRDTTRIIQYADSMAFTKASKFRSYVEIDSATTPGTPTNSVRLFMGAGDKLFVKYPSGAVRNLDSANAVAAGDITQSNGYKVVFKDTANTGSFAIYNGNSSGRLGFIYDLGGDSESKVAEIRSSGIYADGFAPLSLSSSTFTGHWMPGANDTYDEGSAANYWRNVFAHTFYSDSLRSKTSTQPIIVRAGRATVNGFGAAMKFVNNGGIPFLNILADSARVGFQAGEDKWEGSGTSQSHVGFTSPTWFEDPVWLDEGARIQAYGPGQGPTTTAVSVSKWTYKIKVSATKDWMHSDQEVEIGSRRGGNFEWHRIASVSNDTITIATQLAYDHASGEVVSLSRTRGLYPTSALYPSGRLLVGVPQNRQEVDSNGVQIIDQSPHVMYSDYAGQSFSQQVIRGGSVSARSPTSMYVSVARGLGEITSTNAHGDTVAYSFAASAQDSVAIATSDPSNARWDLVYWDSSGVVRVASGTPAASPALPSIPAKSVALAKVVVGAGVTTIVSGNITDIRPFYTVLGQPIDYTAPRFGTTGAYPFYLTPPIGYAAGGTEMVLTTTGGNSTAFRGYVSGAGSTLITSPKSVGTSSNMCGLSGGGYDSTVWAIGANINIVSGQSWSTTSHPAYITFNTNPTGSTTRSERVRIDTSGNVGIGDATPAALLTVGSGDLFQVSSTGKVASVLGVATQGNTGVPTVVIDSVRTGQSAAITASTIYAVPASGAGRYRISWSATITTAATTSSTLGGAGGFQVVYTDNTDNVVKTTVTGNSVTSTANTTGTAISGVLIANCKASTNLQYQFGYTSSGATAMVYDLTVLVEKF